MGGFAEAMRDRVRVARAAVAAAQQAEDAYEVAVAEDELDDALRLARSSGVDPDSRPEQESRGAS